MSRGGGAEVSLAQLHASGTPITLDEAVAIVQQTARVLLDHPGTPAVDLAGVFLQESGDVVLRLSRFGDPEASVRSMGELLRALLAATPSPTPLNQVIADSTTIPPACKSVSEMSQALSRFERRDRLELTRGVYHRWRTSTALAARRPGMAAAAAERVQPDPTTWQFAPSAAMLRAMESQRRRTIFNISLAAFAAVVVLLIALSDWQVVAGVRRLARTVAIETALLAERAGPALVDAVDGGFERMRAPFSRAVEIRAPGPVAPGPGAPPDEPAGRFRANAPPRVPQMPTAGTSTAVATNPRPPLFGSGIADLRTSSQQTAVAQASPDRPAALDFQAALPEPDNPPSTAAEGSPQPLPLARTSITSDRRDLATVYSQTDPDVTPPAPIDRQLLDSPPSGSQQFVALDIVVDETGRVETATLVGRPASMREAMLATGHLSAAKTWRFRPASRDGEAVKYRRRVWLVARD